MSKMVDISVDIGGIRMKNPIMAASGCFGYGVEYKDLYNLDELGAFVTKGITLRPRKGYTGIRIVETRAGILNAIGLENPGTETFIKRILPKLREFRTPVIVNIAGSTADEYGEVARRLNDQEGIAGLEVNISCPNIRDGGLAFGAKPKSSHTVIKKVRKAANLPIIAKLSPNVTDITEIAKSVVEAGTDAISLINTLVGMALDIHTRRPKLANITGGLSGPAIKPVAVGMVWKCYDTICKKAGVPIIGMGGIEYLEDAIEFFLAGATAIAIGTANFVDPNTCHKIAKQLRKHLQDTGVGIRDIIGKVQFSPERKRDKDSAKRFKRAKRGHD